VSLIAFLILDLKIRAHTVVLCEYGIRDGEDLSALKGKPGRVLRKSIIIARSLYPS